MRTTIRIDDDLLADAKRLAAETGRTLTAVVEDALREVLARRKKEPAKRRFSLPTINASGLRPGVDLNNSAALLDLMESSDDID
jgi:hypothetical protein